MKIKHGIVNLEEMHINIQFDINKKCPLVKLPTYTQTWYEKESLGNGWYGSNKEKITCVQDNAYLVLNNEKPIGFIITKTNGRVYLQGKNSDLFIKNYIIKHYETC